MKLLDIVVGSRCRVTWLFEMAEFDFSANIRLLCSAISESRKILPGKELAIIVLETLAN